MSFEGNGNRMLLSLFSYTHTAQSPSNYHLAVAVAVRVTNDDDDDANFFIRLFRTLTKVLDEGVSHMDTSHFQRQRQLATHSITDWPSLELTSLIVRKLCEPGK